LGLDKVLDLSKIKTNVRLFYGGHVTTDEVLTKGERTRQAVIDAAYSLFLEKGFSATSMRQIAERAGLALGGIYNHFSSKDEIFQALVIAKHPYIRIFPVLQRAPGNTIEEFIRNVAQLVQEEMGGDPDFIKLMFIEIVEFNGKHIPKMFEIILPMGLPLIQRFATPECGLQEGIPTLTMIRIFVGNILAFYMTGFLMSSDSIPAGIRDVTLEDFMEVFMHGILQSQPDNLSDSFPEQL
jgi:AcrR family transcriptional regulator